MCLCVIDGLSAERVHRRGSCTLPQRRVSQTPIPILKSPATEGRMINLVTFSLPLWGLARIDASLICPLFKWVVCTNQITFHALKKTDITYGVETYVEDSVDTVT